MGYAVRKDGQGFRAIESKNDCLEHEIYSELEPKPNEPSVDDKIKTIVYKIQSRLDDFAQTRNYDSCLSCCTYATSTVEKFSNEAQTMINLRDATWSSAYDILNKYQAGEIEEPSFDDVISELPVLAWD